MNEQDFLNEAEKDQNETMSEFQERVMTYTRRLGQLELNAKESWEETPEFRSMVLAFGEYPPLKLLEDLLSYYKAKKQDLVTKFLPTLLKEQGLELVKLQNGQKVDLDHQLSIKTINEEQLKSWLVEKGYGEHFKDTFIFPKGEAPEEMAQTLIEAGISFEHVSGIHAQTLKKILSDRYNAKQSLPDESIVEIKPFTVAKVK